MVNFSALLLALSLAAAATAGPTQFTKRISQTISDSTTKWEAACVAAGGGGQCSNLAVSAFSTLLAAAGNCDQQNAGDQMMDLAKTLKSDEMIALTQIFVQQPRNTPNSLSVPYCLVLPKNKELNGLFQCQFQGANPNTFVGNLAVGKPGTIPLGHNGPLNPPGSCPAHTSGPIANGDQLNNLVNSPGVPV